MSDDLNFDRADYTQPPPPEYLRANSPASAAFPRALLFGLGAALLGSLLYAAFTIVTHIVIGYVALGVGYLVGKAMMAGPNPTGGRNYQIAAALLTYLSVSLAFVPETLWALHKRGMDLGHFSSRSFAVLTGYGIVSPFLGLTDGIGGLLGLFILFIGIRAAWRLTSARPAIASHPFTAS